MKLKLREVTYEGHTASKMEARLHALLPALLETHYGCSPSVPEECWVRSQPGCGQERWVGSQWADTGSRLPHSQVGGCRNVTALCLGFFHMYTFCFYAFSKYYTSQLLQFCLEKGSKAL